MPNRQKNGHNKNIIKLKSTEPLKRCNSFVKKDCVMNGIYLFLSILYQDTLKCNDAKYKMKRWKTISETSFKKRTANQKKHSSLLTIKMTPSFP